MTSPYHNCPTINNVSQHDGTSYTSDDVHFQELPNGEGVHFLLDLAKAYPKNAHVTHWVRSLLFNQTANSVHLSEEYQLEDFLHPQQLHFILPPTMVVDRTENGLLLHNSQVNVQMLFDWSLWEASKIEERSLEKDHKLTSIWGDSIQRLTLTTNSHHQEVKGQFNFTFISGW